MIAEIMNEDVSINFDHNSTKDSHYSLTPYQYVPKSSVKLVSSEYIDMSQGLLELISDISNET